MDYDMSGPAADSNVVTGMKAGLGDSTVLIATSFSNSYLAEVSVMFIGLSVIISLILMIVFRHKGMSYTSTLGKSQSAERKYAESVSLSEYLKQRDAEQSLNKAGMNANLHRGI